MQQIRVKAEDAMTFVYPCCCSNQVRYVPATVTLILGMSIALIIDVEVEASSPPPLLGIEDAWSGVSFVLLVLVTK